MMSTCFTLKKRQRVGGNPQVVEQVQGPGFIPQPHQKKGRYYFVLSELHVT
jgi:hypothetical protein